MQFFQNLGRALMLPIAGEVKPLADVPDATFADGIMGPGLAIEPTGDTVTAPAAGTVTSVFPTGHAVGLTLDDGTEVLVHVSIDTVKLGGTGFETLVEKGAQVDVGDPLLRVDLEAIRGAGYATITPVVVLNKPSVRVEFR